MGLIASRFGFDYYISRAREFEPPRELWDELGRHGYLGVSVPERFGGGVRREPPQLPGGAARVDQRNGQAHVDPARLHRLQVKRVGCRRGSALFSAAVAGPGSNSRQRASRVSTLRPAIKP